MQIKFGTDGWRAIIADDYTVENVKRVAYATALWLKKNSEKPVAVIGHDCRFGGELFAETTANVLCSQGVKVFLAEGFVSTPMVSLGCKNYGAEMGVVITASHNPPSYNGYKLKSKFGGPSDPAIIQEVEDMIPEKVELNLKSVDDYEKENLLEYVNLEFDYVEHVKKNFDLEAINNSSFSLAYDSMFGAGQKVIPQIIPNAILVHCEYNPGFNGQAPEPLHKNLSELSSLIKNSPGNVVGLATDGDADRIGMYDEDGNFVDAHHIILLLIHYLHVYKKMTGKVVIAFSVSEKVRKMCEQYGIEVEVTKIGFKYISSKMVTEDVLVGGEESGGIAVKGHIPERDGIWDGLVLLEFMAKTGKTLKQLIQEVYDVVGSFCFDRLDLHLPEEQKQKIISLCKNDAFNSFDSFSIVKKETIDGFKYHLSDNEWVMIRASGTEPLLRIYAEASTREGVQKILQTLKQIVLNS